MDLEQYRRVEVRRITNFYNWWAVQNVENPKDFPLEMEPGHWEDAIASYELDGEGPSPGPEDYSGAVLELLVSPADIVAKAHRASEVDAGIEADRSFLRLVLSS